MTEPTPTPEPAAHAPGPPAPAVERDEAPARSLPLAHAPSIFDDRRIAYVFLSLSSLLVLWFARGYLAPYGPLGDDASSHITTIASFARILQSGAGWWSQDYNLGFPLALYYQPLPHLASAVLCLLLGGPGRAMLTYKIVATALIVLQPWAIYAGARRAGLTPLEAALAGAVAPLIHEGISFGYSPRASLTIGLYTQNWGNVALPLAVGELVRVVRGRGSVTTTMLAAVFVASCHMFYAIALVPIVALTWAVATFADAIGGLRHGGLASLLVARAKSLGRLALAGVGAGAILSAWLVPLAGHQAYFGGWPFGRATRVHGYGWLGEDGMLTEFTDGHLMDAGGVPILLLLAVIGLVVAAVHARSERLRWVVVGAVWSLLGVAGRNGLDADAANGFERFMLTFGKLTAGIIDLYPLHGNVQLFRYGALLQFFLLLAIGIGLATLVRALPAKNRVIATAVALVGAGVVLSAPIQTGSQRLDAGFRTIIDAGNYRASSYAELIDWLAELPEQGRLYVGPKSGVRSHFHSGLLAYWRQGPAGQSYGVGLHDSLHFYTLEYYRLDHEGARTLADLYDFRFIVTTPAREMPQLGERTVIEQNDHYELAALDVSGQSVVLMGEAEPLQGTPRGVRRETRSWLMGNGPALGITRVLEVDDPRDREGLTSAPRRVSERDRLDASLAIGGTVRSSHMGQSTVTADVVLEEPGLIVAKVGYHPFWQVTLDGEPVETLYALPGFVAARAPAGEHRFEASYRWPASSRRLLWLIPLALFGAAAFDRRTRRAA